MDRETDPIRHFDVHCGAKYIKTRQDQTGCVKCFVNIKRG